MVIGRLHIFKNS